MTPAFIPESQAPQAAWHFLFKLSLPALLLAVNGCATGVARMPTTDTACPITLTNPAKEPPQGLQNPEDKLIVDCLLPGQLIHTGMYTTWMSRPRPAIISAWECAVQGGDYAAGTGNDARQKAINVWQECADNGDKAAQNYLGEIYAKNWGTIKPDYPRAAEWFRKAAAQGYSRAQNNLGTLYEQGLGVPKDRLAAYKLIRQAIGVIDPVNLDENTAKEIEELDQKQNTTDQQLKKLQQQLGAAEQRLLAKQTELEHLKSAHQQDQILAIKTTLKAAQEDKTTLQGQLAATQQLLATLRKQAGQTKTQAALSDLPDLGQYHALVIGINGYQSPLHPLKTPVNDAKKVAALLRDKYSFQTTLITDDTPIKPTRSGIINALVQLRDSLATNDNLLVYYAGHGDISNGYSWLALNAESASPADWISADDITKQISIPPMNAKHVLIVVDSCFPAGLINATLRATPITTAAIAPPLLDTRAASSDDFVATMPLALSNFSADSSEQLVGSTPQAQVAWIKAKAKLPSRSTLTSGRLEKVLDEDSGNGLSIFANAFIEVLKNNAGALSAEQVSLELSPKVFAMAQKKGGSQVPIYAPIEKTGDNHGEFFFIPRTR